MNEDAFARRRSLLFTVAYEMLGSASDAEDVVQEAWLRWSNVDHADVRDPRAYLVGIVTRQALNRLRSLARRREDYVGEWLPEPLLTSPDVAADVELAESVSIAMLTVLETLAAGRARGVRASLSSDRLEMLVDRSIRIGKLGHLTRLSDAQLADRRRQDRHRAGSDTRGELAGLRQHEISGEQCRAGALDGVDGRCAAPRQRAVEQVIVNQRANLDELGGYRRSYDALVVDAAEPGAGDGECRTQALAASVGDPPTRGGERRRTVKGVLEAPLDVAELGAEVGHSEQPGEVVGVHRRRGGSLLAVRAGRARLGARPCGWRFGRPGAPGPE
jgi:hypothetical protein